MTEILGNIAEYSVVVALLVVMVIYFLQKEKKKEAEIVALQKELRDTEKDNVVMLLKLSGLMDKLSANNEKVVQDIQILKEYLKDKLDEINRR